MIFSQAVLVLDSQVSIPQTSIRAFPHQIAIQLIQYFNLKKCIYIYIYFIRLKNAYCAKKKKAQLSTQKGVEKKKGTNYELEKALFYTIQTSWYLVKWESSKMETFKGKLFNFKIVKLPLFFANSRTIQEAPMP